MYFGLNEEQTNKVVAQVSGGDTTVPYYYGTAAYLFHSTKTYVVQRRPH